jgi:hypothetical protein
MNQSINKIDETLSLLVKKEFLVFLTIAFSIINPGEKFLANWHLDIIAEYLHEVTKGNIKRLIINLPPRSLKSITANVAWPAWLLGNDPTLRIVSASYSNTLSYKHSNDCRHLIQSEFFRKIFPNLQISKTNNKKEKFITTKQGFRFATSVSGTATGEGGDILIIDDPHNASHICSKHRRENVINCFQQSFSSRLDNKKEGKIILIMQRLHRDDLTGFLLDNQPNNWEHLCIPAIANHQMIYNIGRKYYDFAIGQSLHSERESNAEIERAQNELGKLAFSAQYLQIPLQNDNGMICKNWFFYYDNINLKDINSFILFVLVGAKRRVNIICLIFCEINLNIQSLNVKLFNIFINGNQI